MIPPLVSYVTFNRLGLTVKNLTSILETTDDFEMHIIDNHSSDGTWEFIQSLTDSRIKTKTRIDINAGLIYALNINLLRRRPDQYFITVDNDVYIETKDWITRFMLVFNKFPELGILGVEKGSPYPKKLPPFIQKTRDEVSYLEVYNSRPNPERNYVPDCCMCIRPELANEIGYFSEENCFGEIELSYRVNNFTKFKTGFATNIKIKMPQTIPCNECQYQEKCSLDKSTETCFTKYQKLYKNDEFKKRFKWKFDETVVDMNSGARQVYCASSNDGSSTSNHIFNMEWALENFGFFINNAN